MWNSADVSPRWRVQYLISPRGACASEMQGQSCLTLARVCMKPQKPAAMARLLGEWFRRRATQGSCVIEALIYLKVERYLVLAILITNGFATLMIGLAPCEISSWSLLLDCWSQATSCQWYSNVDFNVFIIPGLFGVYNINPSIIYLDNHQYIYIYIIPIFGDGHQSIPIVCRLNPLGFSGEILADGIIPSG